jgi:catechol 2,3-dioxygenase-like lactoylglutathione lyase family enzyme
MIALFESHLTVADMPRSIAFYRDVVGLELAYRGESLLRCRSGSCV